MSTIYDYVPDAVPNYLATLIVDPQNVLEMSGSFDQVKHQGFGVSSEVITFSSQPRFYLQLQWTNMKKVEYDLLFNWYFDTNKAYGISRSFYFKAPEQYEPDIHKLYVCKFASDWQGSFKTYGSYAIGSIILEVVGKMGAGTTTTSSSSTTSTSSSSSTTTTAP